MFHLKRTFIAISLWPAIGLISPAALLVPALVCCAAGFDTDSPYGVVAFIPSPTRWDAMRNASITWGRCGFSWRDIETPTQGTYNWAVTDDAVNQANVRGIHIYAGLGYTPTWASAGGHSYDPPTNSADWASFVTACVTRYKASIHHWEIWNEPNLSQFWGGSQTQYINNILKVGADAVHAADPDALVVAPEVSSCCNAQNWVTTALNSAPDKIDIICYHQYDGGDTVSGRLSALDSMHNAIVVAGYANKPLWITECGWTSDSIGEQAQANDLTGMLAGMPSRPWFKRFFWYQIWEGSNTLFGLLHQDESPKLDWYAYQSYTAAHPAPVMVWDNSGPTDTEHGLSRVAVADGDTTAVTQIGRSARRNLDPSQDFYVYYNVADNFAFQGSRPAVSVTFDYYDGGSGSLSLQYDSIQGGAYKSAGSIALAGKNTWKQFTFTLSDAYFGNRQNSGADFRIAGGAGMTFYLDQVEVSAGLLPPQISLSPTSLDRVVVHGSNLPNDSFNITNTGDLPLNYTINSNAAWASASPTSGSASAEVDPITVIYSTSTLPLGTTSAFLSVADPNASNSPQTFTINLRVVSIADFDQDGDVDQSDFAHLQACFSPVTLGPPPAGCADADLQGDGTVNGADLNLFLSCMGGAGKPPGC